jgi:hypothetical protein
MKPAKRTVADIERLIGEHTIRDANGEIRCQGCYMAVMTVDAPACGYLVALTREARELLKKQRGRR